MLPKYQNVCSRNVINPALIEMCNIYKSSMLTIQINFILPWKNVFFFYQISSTSPVDKFDSSREKVCNQDQCQQQISDDNWSQLDIILGLARDQPYLNSAEVRVKKNWSKHSGETVFIKVSYVSRTVVKWLPSNRDIPEMIIEYFRVIQEKNVLMWKYALMIRVSWVLVLRRNIVEQEKQSSSVDISLWLMTCNDDLTEPSDTSLGDVRW